MADDAADQAAALQDAVRESAAHGTPLAIVGHGSKPSPFRPAPGAPVLATCRHAGVIDYRPSELVVTARAGTPLAALEAVLAGEGQMLPFDPPRFGGRGTLGGALAAGISGPGRPWLGGVRDAVLGVEIVNGLGERLRFGGSVIKNVAGYDVSRLMAGALGTLGVILAASLRVVPRPAVEQTFAVACNARDAGRRTAEWLRTPLPVTGTCFVGGWLRVRLAGHAAAVRDAAGALGLEVDAAGAAFWAGVRDHAHPFFAGGERLDRLWLPRGAYCGDDHALVEWGGCQAWLRGAGDAGPDGALLTYRGGDDEAGQLRQAPPVRAKYERRVKAAFDPKGVLNPSLSPAAAAP